jgi:hypothetical protein
VYANRRRIRGERGKRLLKKRGELLERPFNHYLDNGGMRRAHLRGRENILKRLLVQVAGFNLGILMRRWLGAGTPGGAGGGAPGLCTPSGGPDRAAEAALAALRRREADRSPLLAIRLLIAAA